MLQQIQGPNWKANASRLALGPYTKMHIFDKSGCQKAPTQWHLACHFVLFLQVPLEMGSPGIQKAENLQPEPETRALESIP